jgi:hypothetical protein
MFNVIVNCEVNVNVITLCRSQKGKDAFCIECPELIAGGY